MKRFIVIALSLGCILTGAHTFAIQRTGIVERFTGSTFCLQGTSHVITDPCASSPVLHFLDPDPLEELDPFECRHVDLDGPDVGITCSDIVDPETIVPTSPGCFWGVRGMTVAGGSDAALGWGRTVCAGSYDVIRGTIPPGAFASTVGFVLCLANDVPQNTDFRPQISGPTDSEIPAVGEVFFYLVKANTAPHGGNTYGRGSNGTVRVPLAGDCAL